MQDTAEQQQAPWRGQVIKSYTAQYSDPLTVRAGERLVGEREEPWEDNPAWIWVWCSDAHGKSGWVPRTYIVSAPEGAHARYDYTTAELSVAEGAVVTIERAESGWLWCHTDDARAGWVPASHVAQSAG